MSAAKNKLQKRHNAIKQIEDIYNDAKNVNVIHYSCESFYDLPANKSPRIASIVIKNLSTSQTKSFSIHRIAERRNISLENIEENYSSLEKEMLKNFYAYVKSFSDSIKWLHWNMKDDNYGFAAIEHRYQVLQGSPIFIKESQLFNLAKILIDKYGSQYMNDPRLINLAKFNNITFKDGLSGEEEAIAFNSMQYILLHFSTHRKVSLITSIIESEWDGTLKTKSSWKDEYGTSIQGYIEKMTDTLWFKILAFISIPIAIISFFIQIIQR